MKKQQNRDGAYFVKVFLCFTALAFLVIVGRFLYQNNDVFELAYFSYSDNCNVLTQEEIKKEGYSLGGTYTPQDKTIQIYNAPEIDPEKFITSYKHEQCHAMQDRQHRLFGCTVLQLNYLVELECYIRERV